MMGLTILGRRRPRKPLDQGRRSSDVLSCPREVWEHFITLNDPLVHIAGHGVHTPTVSVVLDLSLELRAFLLELESCFVKLLVLGLQLLHPPMGWGGYIPLDLVIEVVHQGSLLLTNAFDVSLGGTCHKTFMRGVMASPVGVRARGRLQLSYEEVVGRFHDMFGHPHELVVHG